MSDPQAIYRGEKDRRRSGLHRLTGAFEGDDGVLSMTRLVAFMFAVVICMGITRMSVQNQLHAIGWPFAAVAITTMLAVPLQALFKTLGEWFKSKPGAELVKKIANAAVDEVTDKAKQVVSMTANVTQPKEDLSGA